MLRTENDIADKLAALPGVSGVGFASAAPMQGIEPDWNNVFVEGKHYNDNVAPLRLFNNISPGYFHAMGTRVMSLDATSRGMICSHASVGCMVSESIAREEWGSAAAAVGKRITAETENGSPGRK